MRLWSLGRGAAKLVKTVRWRKNMFTQTNIQSSSLSWLKRYHEWWRASMQSSCSPQSLLKFTKTSSIIIPNYFSIINYYSQLFLNYKSLNAHLPREHKGKVRWAAISREGDMALTCGQVGIVGTFFSLDIMQIAQSTSRQLPLKFHWQIEKQYSCER